MKEENHLSNWDEVFGAPSTPKEPEEKKDTQPTVEAVEEKTPEPENKSEQVVKEPVVKEPSDIQEVMDTGAEVFCIYGSKGHGKTFLTYSFPGDIAVIMLDGKSISIKKHQYGNDSRIHVYDGRAKLDETSAESWLRTSEQSFLYINEILDNLNNGKLPKPDWILIDGQQEYTSMAEMTMRYRNNLQPYQGIGNMNIWKERRQYLRQLHYKALRAAKKGIIYTVYVTQDKEIRNEIVTKQRDKPKWLDVIESESDIVIRVDSETENNRVVYTANIDSCKTRTPLNNQTKFNVSKYEYDKDGNPTEREFWGIGAIFPDMRLEEQ
tara:strand:+ start:504 stop:1472 length:969 start_codon:yes stop_codon:yes gene_type:complete